MRTAVLLREAVTSARASAVPTALIALVVAATCFVAIATVGRQAALEDAVAEKLAGPSSRLLTVTDLTGAGVLRPSVVDVLARVDGVQAVLGSDIAVDAYVGTLGRGSQPVAVLPVHGTLTSVVELVAGRLPGPGEAVVTPATAARLGLRDSAGWLASTDGQQWAVVGVFEPRSPFESLAGASLTPAVVDADEGLAQVRVLADHITAVRQVQASALTIIDADPSRVQVQAAAAAADTSEGVSGVLQGLGRGLLLLIMGVGGFFVAVVVLSDVLVRRRDLGRRRTLGITRSDLVVLVAARTAVAAVLGSVLGAGAGVVAAVVGGGGVGIDFAAAVAVLGAVTAVVACLAPAVYASRRDPVEVMRVA